MNETQSAKAERYTNGLLSVMMGFPWVDILSKVWKLGRKILRQCADEGIYEVLDYEVTLALQNETGTRAMFKKRKRVRYLQNGVIAYADSAWGDGKILVGYKCSPGVAVDQYRSGYKTHILLSLREVKNRGDEDEFNIQWGIHNGFLKPNGFWDTNITNRTHQIKINVIFPKSRPPQRCALVESNRGKTYILRSDAKHQLPDGRWLVSWQKEKPRLYEHYLFKWWW